MCGAIDRQRLETWPSLPSFQASSDPARRHAQLDPVVFAWKRKKEKKKSLIAKGRLGEEGGREIAPLSLFRPVFPPLKTTRTGHGYESSATG